jgi:hypothetical protein
VWGGAVSAALQIKNIPTGAGDDVKIEGTVGKGATKYIIGTAFALPGSFGMTKANAFTTAGTIAIGAINDGVYGGWMTPLRASVQLTRGWGFRGALNLALLRLGQNQSLCGCEVEALSELAPRSQQPRVPWKGGYPD